MLAKAHPGHSAQPKLSEELITPMRPPQGEPQRTFWGETQFFFMQKSPSTGFGSAVARPAGNSHPLYAATQRAFCGGWGWGGQAEGGGHQRIGSFSPVPAAVLLKRSCSEGNKPPEGGGRRD